MQKRPVAFQEAPLKSPTKGRRQRAACGGGGKEAGEGKDGGRADGGGTAGGRGQGGEERRGREERSAPSGQIEADPAEERTTGPIRDDSLELPFGHLSITISPSPKPAPAPETPSFHSEAGWSGSLGGKANARPRFQPLLRLGRRRHGLGWQHGAPPHHC